MNFTMPQQYVCPLCASMLTREKWIKITGQWEERQKFLDKTKREIEKYKKENLELEKRHKADLLKAAKAAEVAGIAKGIKKEKSERERMNKMLQNQAKAIMMGQKKIQELQKQLRDGKTPQTAGFDYEKEVERMLAETFPQDNIKSTGKKGDVMHTIIIEESEVGTILYECKKTEKYSNEFIKEIKRHQDMARADYAVVVTHAQKENKSKFFVEEGVIVIDPLGLLDIAYLLRNALLDVHKLKLTKAEAEQKGREILRYMQSGDFKKNMVDNLEKTISAYNVLVREVKQHRKDWEERIRLYAAIHQNTMNVRLAIGQIILGKQLENLDAPSFPKLEGLEILKLESGE